MKIVELSSNLTAPRAFHAFSRQPYPVLLDSVQPLSPLSRRSYMAADPFLTVHAKGERAALHWPRSGRREGWQGNLFTLLRKLLEEHPAPQPGPFPLACGGAVGYLSYDLFPHVERVGRSVSDDIGMPDLFLAFYDTIAVFDRKDRSRRLAATDWGHGSPEERVGRWHELLERPLPALGEAPRVEPDTLVSNFSPEAYRKAIVRAKEYIAAGDIYQANISQRFTLPYSGDPLALYERLRRTSPAPFAACLFPDGFAILSNSPERYLLIDGDYIETRPIKGTRPRGRDPEEDRALAEELRRSEKDRAEHVMIVDLERNDLGRVCAYDSVHVPEFEVIESYANVHHMVSTVAGRVHPSRDTTACIRNSFPGGSITGAPKVRSMEIIEELEPTARGVYCGSIGYIDFSGRVDLNIAIRTAVLGHGKLHFQVGGGIVADSDPEEEYQETLTKGQSFLKVLTGEGRVWDGQPAA